MMSCSNAASIKADKEQEVADLEANVKVNMDEDCAAKLVLFAFSGPLRTTTLKSTPDQYTEDNLQPIDAT